MRPAGGIPSDAFTSDYQEATKMRSFDPRFEMPERMMWWALIFTTLYGVVTSFA
jgi:hypothetical protein